jgi:bifunctional non-homologous end joining protein LigD
MLQNKNQIVKQTAKNQAVDRVIPSKIELSEKETYTSEIKISNFNKIYWPELKITKGMLIEYYKEVAPYIMPFIKNRLHTLNRYPNGIYGTNFYQKNIDTDNLPIGLETVVIRNQSDEKDVHYLLCKNEEALIYMANMGCIEINPWSNTYDAYDYPDWMVIDLDPVEIGFKDVIKTALEVRKLYEEINIESYIKTSGSKGMHIYVPMGQQYTYNEVRLFAELIARKVSSRIPNITSIIRSPAKRKNRIYLDYLQNRHGQTLVAPFSARPKPEATVSMPLEWNELNMRLYPEKFTMKNILSRADKAFEIWKPVLGIGVNIKKSIEMLNTIE